MINSFIFKLAEYSSAEKSGVATTSCETGQSGSLETYTVPAGTYTSNIDQQDADNQAIADVEANKQSYANDEGTCITDSTGEEVGVTLKLMGNPDPNSDSYTGVLQMAGLSEMDELLVFKTTPAGSDGTTALSYDGNNIGTTASSFDSTEYADGLAVVASASDTGMDSNPLNATYTFTAKLSGSAVKSTSFTLTSDNSANP
jgi:hypothetical protein